MSNWQNFFSNLPSPLKFLFVLGIGVDIGVSFNDEFRGLILPNTQSEPLPVSQTPDDNSLTVTVIVRDENREGIKKATVKLLYGTIPDVQETDDNGHVSFVINNPVQDARVVVSKSGFVEGERNISLQPTRVKKEYYFTLKRQKSNNPEIEPTPNITESPIPSLEPSQNTQFLRSSKVFDFVANLEKCTLQNQVIKCFFSFKNTNEENTSFRVHLEYNSNYQTLLLVAGKDYVLSRIKLGSNEETRNYLDKVIIGEEDYDLEITFENVEIEGNIIPRLLISCWDHNENRAVKFDFKDIPISL
ncbi:MAG: carboxypeptidase regulatory-like domain-containing protein [Cyanobacteria bacterium SBLK]|nr:carboxypeptidase regulatory-like domain-containing protein [Cyanobacteria bacterium SBLK]